MQETKRCSTWKRSYVEIKWSRKEESKRNRWREWKIVSRSPKSAFNPYFIVRGTNEAIALFLALEIIFLLSFFLFRGDGVTLCFGHKYRKYLFDSCKPQLESRRQCNKLDKAVIYKYIQYIMQLRIQGENSSSNVRKNVK